MTRFIIPVYWTDIQGSPLTCHFSKREFQMKKSLQSVYEKHLAIHHPEVVRAFERADQADVSGLTIGPSDREKLFAALRINSVDEIVEMAQLVKSLKYEALVQIGFLLFYFDRYGNMFCPIPPANTPDQFKNSYPLTLIVAGGDQILKKIGVIENRTEKSFNYDFSQCKNTKP